VQIGLLIDGETITATLADNSSARAFADLLPLSLSVRDFHGTEKIADLPAELSTDQAPAGIAPTAGDIAYYAPWGNLAMFYEDFAYSPGLILLGRLDGGPAALTGLPDDALVEVTVLD